MTYEESIQKLETLTQQMEHGEVPIDKMADVLREAQQLLKYCRDRLYAADEAMQQILAADEAEPAPSA